MSSNLKNNDKGVNTIRRIARVWSILIIVIGIVIFIGEIVEFYGRDPALVQPYPWYENLIPLAMITGVLGLALAWRWEGLGSIITIVSVLINLFIFYVVIGGRGQYPWIVALISLPVLIPGILFLVCWVRSQRDGDLAG